MLEWVGKGCSEGTATTYKTSCQALQNRGLVKVSRRSGVWTAALTDAGRHYLAHGTYPAPKSPTRALPIPRLPKVTTPSSPPGVPQQPRKTFTDQLLEELQAMRRQDPEVGPRRRRLVEPCRVGEPIRTDPGDQRAAVLEVP